MNDKLIMCMIEGFIALLITIVSILLFVRIPEPPFDNDAMKNIILSVITLMMSFFVWMKTVETLVEYLHDRK